MVKSVIAGIVIVCGILLSFFIGELNTNNNNIEIKKELTHDLSQSLNDVLGILIEYP